MAKKRKSEKAGQGVAFTNPSTTKGPILVIKSLSRAYFGCCFVLSSVVLVD